MCPSCKTINITGWLKIVIEVLLNKSNFNKTFHKSSCHVSNLRNKCHYNLVAINCHESFINQM